MMENSSSNIQKPYSSYKSTHIIIVGVIILLLSNSISFMLGQKFQSGKERLIYSIPTPIYTVTPIPSPTSVIPSTSVEVSPIISPDQDKFNLTCQNDTECQLIDSANPYKCSGSCEPVDYSLDKWIAVNGQSFQSSFNTMCPPEKRTGVNCFPKPINENFGTQCINNLCKKVPK